MANAELEFMGEQTFVVDPRSQGFGLSEHEFLDGYANKFFLLANHGGVFISPRTIPDRLLDYYNQLDLDMAQEGNIHSTEGLPVIAALEDRSQTELVRVNNADHVIPYMVTAEVEDFASAQGLSTLADAPTTTYIADKANLQRELAAIHEDIAEHTGFDVAIPSAFFKAGDRFGASSYDEMSQGGRRDVVVVKPQSASAMGIFVVRADAGSKGFREVLDKHFAEDEEVLLEEFIKHNHSPSMQGVRINDAAYRHLYMGRQIISLNQGSVEYDASQIPFGPETVSIDPGDLTRIQAVHEALGETVIRDRDISGIAGFDGVAMIDDDGRVRDFKITELNLHLPSTVAVYAATSKLFPDGFEGIAHNVNVSLHPGQTHDALLGELGDDLIQEKQTYGFFPLNLSFPEKADMVIYAQDDQDLKRRLQQIQT
ncbi:MAG TPA: hypothetical protein VK674_04405 [Candidatus Limnocylindria bacterium]|nr:hypothetical protein [Candidatus Limnocylindria bacterium]